MTEQSAETQQVTRAYAEMWNERDYSKLPDLVSESFVVYNPFLPGGETRGRDGLEEWMGEIAAGFPDFRAELLDVLASEDTVMSEVKYTMTHEGEFGGIPPTGREIEFQAMAKFRVEDGKVKEHRDYVNQQELLEQLGVTDQ